MFVACYVITLEESNVLAVLFTGYCNKEGIPCKLSTAFWFHVLNLVDKAMWATSP
jgi:hypothetical protein